MRTIPARTTLALCIILALAGPASASQPTYGTFTLDFAKPPKQSEPNELVARFVYWVACPHGDLTIKIPKIDDEPQREVTCWSGPFHAWDTVSATLPIRGLPLGDYQFTAICRSPGCSSTWVCSAILCVRISATHILTSKFGLYELDDQEIALDLESRGLKGASWQKIQAEAPDIAKRMSDIVNRQGIEYQNPNPDTTKHTRPPRPDADSVKPPRNMGIIQGYSGEPDSAWKKLTQQQRDSIGMAEERRRSDSVRQFGTPVPVDLSARHAAPDTGRIVWPPAKEARIHPNPATDTTLLDSLHLRKWREWKRWKDSVSAGDSTQR